MKNLIFILVLTGCAATGDKPMKAVIYREGVAVDTVMCWVSSNKFKGDRVSIYMMAGDWVEKDSAIETSQPVMDALIIGGVK